MSKQTKYFTFGQNHAHAIDGFTYDKDIVVKITAEDPRAKMVEVFGQKWAFEYNERPDMSFYPRGIKEITA